MTGGDIESGSRLAVTAVARNDARHHDVVTSTSAVTSPTGSEPMPCRR